MLEIQKFLQIVNVMINYWYLKKVMLEYTEVKTSKNGSK